MSLDQTTGARYSLPCGLDPPQTPPGYWPLRGWGYSKDRSLDPIKTIGKDGDTHECNLTST